jgi:hypothetical protein
MKVSTAATNGSPKIKKIISNTVITIALPRAVGSGRGEADSGQIRRSSHLCAEEGGGAAGSNRVGVLYHRQ